MEVIEQFLNLVDIIEITETEQYYNMIDIAVLDDHSFLLSNGIISHNSAAGSIKQARNSEADGVYALKGKIKNTRRLADLADNKEILEIMSILGIEPHKQLKPDYENVIIAVDADCIDENHEIITDKGIKKIKDVNYDDLILTHTGVFKPIEKIIETIKEKYIEIELNGEIFIFSELHQIPVFRNGQIEMIFAKDLKQTDFLLIKNK